MDTKYSENENKIIAKRYADALLEIESNISKEEILKQVLDIQTSLNNSEELRKVMTSPIVSVQEKKGIIENIFSNSNIVVQNFLKLLIDKDRFSILDSIIKEYKSVIDKEHNILNIKVISAFELNENEKAMIKVKMKNVLNKEIDLNWGVNNDIIGGLIFEINDKIIDCSLQHKLLEIKRKIIR